MNDIPKPYTVLIVEDDMLFQSVYSARLSEKGYTVHTAGDGQDALNQMTAAPPDVVLLDLVLPRMNGHDVLKQMRATPALAEIPVIVLTSRGEPEDIKRGMDEGATDYLVKSVTQPKEVLWKIREAIAQKEGEVIPLQVALKENLLDAPRAALLVGKSANLQCQKCRKQLVLELFPRADLPGWFNAHFICPDCGE